MKKILSLFISALLILTALLTLTACKSESMEFIVGDEVYHTAQIKKGVIQNPPEDPTADDIIFLGWYTENGKWDGTALNGMKVYAGYLTLSKSEDGTYTVTGINQYHDDKINIPAEYKKTAVNAIADKAFYANAELTEITLPDSISSIGTGAFAECPKLTSVKISDKNEAYKTTDGNIYSKDGTVLVQYLISKTESEFIIPEDVTTIMPYAFSRSASLASVTIPSGVTVLPNHTFYACSKLENVTFGENSQLNVIEASVFSNCSSLVEITIPKNVSAIKEWVFYSCSSLKTVTFERKTVISEVSEHAFAMTPSLEKIYYDGSIDKWDIFQKGTTSDNIRDLLCDIDGAGVYFAPEGAWTPDAEHEGITYGAWLTEDDYLSGMAPNKWYTGTELLTEHVGTVDNNGTTYDDPEFIPGYVHIFADLTNTSSQIVSGQTQYLKINLGGHTLTLSKGIRVGGNDASHPLATLIITSGKLDIAGGQIQPRKDSTFVIEKTIFYSRQISGNIFYGASSDFIHFKESELIVNGGVTFYLVGSNGGRERSVLYFEKTDIIYQNTTPQTALFVIYKYRSGYTAYDIVFDKDSSITGDIPSLVQLGEAYYNGLVYPFIEQQYVYFEDGFTFNTVVEEYDTYLFAKIDPATGTALPQEAYLVNDDYCIFVYGEIPEGVIPEPAPEEAPEEIPGEAPGEPMN